MRTEQGNQLGTEQGNQLGTEQSAEKLPLIIQAMGVASHGHFEEGSLVAQGNVIVDEISHHRIVAVGQDESELPFLLCDDGDGREVIDIGEHPSEKLIARMHQNPALGILDAKLPVLLVYLMEGEVLFADAVDIEIEFLLVAVEGFEERGGVAVVGEGTYEHNLQVETAHRFSVEVDIVGDGLLLAGQVHALEAADEEVHHLLAAVHGFDVAVNLPVHLVANKLVYALNLDAVEVLGVEIIFCYFHGAS